MRYDPITVILFIILVIFAVWLADKLIA